MLLFAFNQSRQTKPDEGGPFRTVPSSAGSKVVIRGVASIRLNCMGVWVRRHLSAITHRDWGSVSGFAWRITVWGKISSRALACLWPPLPLISEFEYANIVERKSKRGDYFQFADVRFASVPAADR